MLSPQMGLHESASLSGHLMALRDASGLLSIEDVAAQEKTGEFVALPKFLAAGYTTDTFWLRFNLQRTPETTDQWFVEVAPSYLNDVTLFMPRSDGTFEATSMGDLHPYAKRPVPHRNFVFPLRLPDNQPVTVYLRVKTKGTMLVRVDAWQYPGLLSAAQTDTTYYSAYFGLIALGLMTNLVFWFWLRDRIYMSYCGYLAMLGLLMMATGGFAAQWLFPNEPVMANRLVGIALSITYLIGTNFFIGVLRLREHFPGFNRIFDAALIFFAFCALASASGYYGVVAPWLHITLLVINAGEAFAGPWLLWRGHREYLLYTLAFTASFASVLISLLRLMGLLSIDMSSDYITMIATGSHIVLLNIAVAQRVHRAERELRIEEKKTAELTAERDAVKKQRQFVAMISHEFRTPLAIIDATAQSIEIACSQQSCALFESIEPRQEKIRRAVNRMLTLLDNFLTDEKLDLYAGEFKLKPVDLRELASETAKSWCHLLSFPDQLQIELGSESAIVLIDRAMMTLALSNLLDNAMKYSPPGSPIILRVGKTGNVGWIEVKDHGIGIPPEQVEKIFDKFYRTGNALSVPGAGLGLYLVRSIVRHHGGEVNAVSEPNNGSCFRIRLPLVEHA